MHTFGYGDEHDSALMQTMAQRKHGNWYFVNDISKVGECLADSLGMMTKTLASKGRLSIFLNPKENINKEAIEKSRGLHWTVFSKFKAVYDISTIYQGFSKNLGLEISIHPSNRTSLEGSQVDIGKLSVEYHD